jgi:hypothetical protein
VAGLLGCACVFDGGADDEALLAQMRAEHMDAGSRALFAVDLFLVGKVATSMEAEWTSVVEPDAFAALQQRHAELRLVRSSGGDELPRRAPPPLASLRAEHAQVNARLAALHEPPLTQPMLVACRIFSGFAFRKYNAAPPARFELAHSRSRPGLLISRLAV